MRALWVPAAWLPRGDGGSWATNVLFSIDEAGYWAKIERDVSSELAKENGAELLDSPAIAPLINSHSHAFQRAFVGHAERREAAEDDFWSWRDQMYGVALTVTPERLKLIAQRLYRELLRGGYTHVCEFHYVHHQPNGEPYADPYAMSRALIEAAEDTGIGLTLLPVVYERSGFDMAALRPDQRRFSANADWVLSAQRELSREMSTKSLHVAIGAALHSLRAVTPESLATICREATGPIHIHIAEQQAEVDACLKATGMRPVQFLYEQLCSLDGFSKGLVLVHGTHATQAEIALIAKTNSSLSICPTTEANLGDGLALIQHWLEVGVPLSIGSDSHVCRDWREELRLLEYGQRLIQQRRNVLAAPEQGIASTAERLYSAALRGGAHAAGVAKWGFQTGARADLLLLPYRDPALEDVAVEFALDALVFSSPTTPFTRVMVGGRWVTTDAD